MTAECDWGGWTAVWSTLLFWHKWLVESLRHADVATWPSVALKFYTTADPLATAIAVSLVIAALCFLLSLPTNNHSFVDKLWSFTPVYYTLHFALHDKLAHSHVPLNPRLSIMAALVTVWGARLTFNFARKGGYRWSAEDYRWPYIREKVNSTLAFLVFNLTFIATYQHLLLLSIATPAYLAWQNVGAPLNALDLAAAALCAFFITYETVADQQQWTFQNAKHAKLAAGKRLTGVFAAGFNTSGLFRYSRHPNFWAEQSMWCAFYLFGVAASGRWVNWTIVAPLQLILLFQGSTWLTEKITASKYPKYADYQASTSCFFPWFPDAPAPAAAPVASASEKRSTRRDSKGAEAAPATPTAATAQVTDEDEAVPPTTAAKRRTTARKTKAASAEEAAEETLADTPRPQRSARKPARAKATEESVPTRQSSRLRTKA